MNFPENRIIQLCKSSDGVRSPEVVGTVKELCEYMDKIFSEDERESYYIIDVSTYEDDKGNIVLSRYPLMTMKNFLAVNQPKGE